jgi:choline-sulfatase
VARPLRFTFILALAALATTLAAVGGWRYARASAPVNGPIIVISVDTLRADRLPAYGYRDLKTPAFDTLAADGVVFERAYAHAPQTLPAHVTMLTGRLPFETGVRDDAGFIVKTGERLLPQLLRERGYATGGVVSAFLLRKETGISQGFDFFDDEMPAGSLEVRRDGAESEEIAERWLDEQRSSRVFLFLQLYDAHAPYALPARFGDDKRYDGAIVYEDEIVGRLMRYLKSHQLYDRSTIVLVSDHGEGLGDHGEREHGLFLYDETIRVPLIIKQAAGIGAGRRIPDLVQHIDLAPTILELVKAPFPGHMRGRSLKPLLDGTDELPETAVYSEALYGYYHFGASELMAVTDGRHRYIKAPREELYDLKRDPREHENVVGNHATAAVRESLRRALDEIVADAETQAPAPIAAEDRDRLQVLGYVGGPGERPAAASDDRPADPKDRLEIVESYRAAIALAADHRWSQALALLQRIVRAEPDLAEVWKQIATLAIRVDRYDQAVDAYKHAIALRPSDAESQLGAASVLLKLRRLDEARDAAELAAHVSTQGDVQSRAGSHALLAAIALARHDPDGARDEAALAQAVDMTLPMPDYIEARLLYDQGKYADALPLFEQAAALIKESQAAPMAELHFYLADTLARLDRYSDAETHYLEEIRDYPQNTRARAGLATLYQVTGRPAEAGSVITDMVHVSPTPETYAVAARLWKSLGDPRQADAARAESRRGFTELARSPQPGMRR